MQGGLRIRTRSCSNPEPKFGGQGCQGETKQSMTCGPTCQIVLVIGGNKNSEVYSIDQSLEHIKPKLPPKSDLEQNMQFNRPNVMYWRNGILICTIFLDENCHHWDFNKGIWTEMDGRPSHQHFVAGSLTINGKWMLAGGRDKIYGPNVDTE